MKPTTVETSAAPARRRAQPLPDLTEIPPLSAKDEPCLAEVREVLRRHGALERFGITLLHDHFAMDSEELLVETCDTEARTLTIRPEKLVGQSESGDRLIDTSWQLGADGDVIAALVCKVGCFVDLKDNHKRTHQKVQG